MRPPAFSRAARFPVGLVFSTSFDVRSNHSPNRIGRGTVKTDRFEENLYQGGGVKRWAPIVRSCCEKPVTRASGGAYGRLFSVLVFDASNDLGEGVRAMQASPLLAGRLVRLEELVKRGHGAEAALGLGSPGRRVAMVLSMGLVVLKCFRCSAGKSWKARSTSRHDLAPEPTIPG